MKKQIRKKDLHETIKELIYNHKGNIGSDLFYKLGKLNADMIPSGQESWPKLTYDETNKWFYLIHRSGYGNLKDDYLEIMKKELDENSIYAKSLLNKSNNHFGENGNDILQNHHEGGTPLVKGTLWADLLYGGKGNDIIHGNSGKDILLGGDSDDHLYGEAGEDTLGGNSGADYLYGGKGEDHLYGGADNDYLYAGSSENDSSDTEANYLYGGDGDDHLYGAAGDDWLEGGKNGDYIYGGSGKDYIYAGNAKDNTDTSKNYLYGEDGDDLLQGAAGDDFLDGGKDADYMEGGVGDDTYIVDSADDFVVEKADEGKDTVNSSVSYELDENVENLTLTGSDAINGKGNKEDNELTGNDGNNLLVGGDGDDVLKGGKGKDTLKGGATKRIFTMRTGKTGSSMTMAWVP